MVCVRHAFLLSTPPAAKQYTSAHKLPAVFIYQMLFIPESRHMAVAVYLWGNIGSTQPMCVLPLKLHSWRPQKLSDRPSHQVLVPAKKRATRGPSTAAISLGDTPANFTKAGAALNRKRPAPARHSLRMLLCMTLSA